MNISELSPEETAELRRACSIAAEALVYGKGLIKKEASLLEIAQKTDEKIVQLGGGIAFPSQLSLNEVAAHFCPTKSENPILNDQLVKLDVGVHINGWIGDNACTVDLSGAHAELVKAAHEALQNAINAIEPGIQLGEIGRVIQDTIIGYGFSPVRNLGGHGLGQYIVHGTPSIPNYDNGDTREIERGDIFAIEPFATDGSGTVVESSNPTLFSLHQKKPVRDPTTRQILSHIMEYHELPFAQWWLEERFPPFRVNLALRQMSMAGMLRDYPPLVDRAKGMVSQAEHTVLVEDKAVILTQTAERDGKTVS